MFLKLIFLQIIKIFNNIFNNFTESFAENIPQNVHDVYFKIT